MSTRPVITGKKGVVAAGHYLAASAGIKMFAKGGNAVDAGVAAGFALAVLKPHENSLGGECPILIYSPKGNCVKAISGQGVAPAKATVSWFKENGIEEIPGDGFLPATVPGMFGAYCTALLYYGRLKLADVLEPAIEIAAGGFPVYGALRNSIASCQKRFLEEWPSSAEVFMPDMKVPKNGQILKQPALAKTLGEIAAIANQYSDRENAIEKAIEHFYHVMMAERIIKFTKNNFIKDATGRKHGALLEPQDFYDYTTKIEDPVYVDYRNYRVFKCGPWTQGPVFLQQLKLLEGFDLAGMKHNSGDYIHLLIEAAKLAFADREKYYGDPDFSEVPLSMLLSGEYNAKMRKRIDLKKANNDCLWELSHDSQDAALYTGDTTHLDTIDEDGMMMSATPSGGWIPSSPVIPDLGFPLGTRAQVFNLNAGHPNCIEPKKRPRTTLTPSIAFKDGMPWLAFGTQGGDMQDQWTLQFFLNVSEFNMDLQQAIDEPTFHTEHFPNSFYPHGINRGMVSIEEGIGLETAYKLQELGHKIRLVRPNSNGQVCAVSRNPKTGIIEGAASAKYDGQAYVMSW